MSSRNILDRLPDEMLCKILHFALVEEQPFWLEHCTKLPRHRMSPGADEFDWLPPGYRVEPGSIVYPPKTVDERLTVAVEPSQTVHQKGWRMVNSTCRRIRRLGKPAYFGAKKTVMSSSMPDKLKSGKSWLDKTFAEKNLAWERHRLNTYASLTTIEGIHETPESRQQKIEASRTWCGLSAEDQAMVLSQIRHVVLSDIAPSSPSISKIIKLPTLLNVFPKVTKCTLLLGCKPAEGVQSFEEYVPDPKIKHPASHTVGELFELLSAIGVSYRVELSVGLSENLDWEHCQRHMVNGAFPMLKFRARLLGKDC
ncbi:Fc.00g047040.m01.CDS01 [Cosmosporella sp. VM-42]